ncbi:MAG: glycosyltransferase family 4 protein [Chloroflexi bacterium]|nr:glycosyltransferase family 4 protein [Chloroflexota bacterium]
MRIAQVAPLFESVPPKLYGGTERVVSWLTEELVRQGHEVTLFASGDSVTAARLVPVCERSLRLDEQCHDELAHIVLGLEQVIQTESQFDFVHWHVDYICYPLARRMRTPHANTLHGRLDIPELVPLYRQYREIPVISISRAQRDPLPWINWQGNVHHGLPETLFTFRDQPGDYLAFLGRISPEKGVDRAIEIAQRTGMTLKIAAKISKPDQPYYDEVIKPLIARSPQVEFLGEISEKEKNDFLGRAYALLFPISWPEPFGLVMIEAMACGTPTIAFPGGSVAEVMESGASGFVVKNVAEAEQAVERVARFNRKKCRRVFERRFTDKIMTQNYVKIYRRLIAEQSAAQPWSYKAATRNGRDGSLQFPSELPTR